MAIIRTDIECPQCHGGCLIQIGMMFACPHCGADWVPRTPPAPPEPAPEPKPKA